MKLNIGLRCNNKGKRFWAYLMNISMHKYKCLNFKLYTITFALIRILNNLIVAMVECLMNLFVNYTVHHETLSNRVVL